MKPPQDDAAGLDDCEYRHGDTRSNESVLDPPSVAGEYENGRAPGISQDRIRHRCASYSFWTPFVAKLAAKPFRRVKLPVSRNTAPDLVMHANACCGLAGLALSTRCRDRNFGETEGTKWNLAFSQMVFARIRQRHKRTKRTLQRSSTPTSSASSMPISVSITASRSTSIRSIRFR